MLKSLKLYWFALRVEVLWLVKWPGVYPLRYEVSAWAPYIDDGYTPAEALREEMSNWDWEPIEA
jgi:hypothetical protein